MGRVLIASNRLPVTVRTTVTGGWELQASVGGLATGLAGVHEHSGGLWIGWPGKLDGLSSSARQEVDAELEARRLAPVDLDPEVARRFYEGYSNGVLWPLFHSLLDALPDEQDFEAYGLANERFADVICAAWRAGDSIWIHDYHLMLLPALLRERLPDAHIGFFLHIPFPASPLLRVLPQRERLLEGLLGADLIGFHTPSYVRHFAASILRCLGVDLAVDRVRWKGREVHVGTFPMGIDARAFSSLSDERAVARQARRLRRGGSAVMVGIDRLDYTKGIQRRLLALQQLLRVHPEWRGKVRLIQVAVPSRTSVHAYRKLRQAIDALVGEIQGTFGTPDWVPVNYLYRGLSPSEVTALYRAADVALVTPIRDGMNLVAKEFVASRNDEDGVLILSEFAGASGELAEALMVNPFDIEATAEACHRALTMSRDERRTRMRALRRRVFDHDVQHWAKSFLDALERACAPQPGPHAITIEIAAERARAANELVLFLDYDGTLMPFDEDPARVAPDDELMGLLARLCARQGTRVHLVSGRTPENLTRWFGELTLALHAEHGLWSRESPGARWRLRAVPKLANREGLAAILEDYAERTPGAHVERKTHGFVWHWRGVASEFGQHQANELRLQLASVCCNLPIEVFAGNRVVEVRPHGAHKGVVVDRVLAEIGEGACIVALGDDRTDEDLFHALPENALAIHVGEQQTRAPLRLADWRAARRFLAALSS
jgi:trehalose 6-phosphate synthase/phosphatase